MFIEIKKMYIFFFFFKYYNDVKSKNIGGTAFRLNFFPKSQVKLRENRKTSHIL